MERIFLDLVNRSIAAGWLVLAVAVLRLAFRRMPKKYFVVLWALVAVRLLLPFSVESGLSLIPSRETVPQEVLTVSQPELRSGIPAVDRVVNPVLGRTFAPAAADMTGNVPAKTAAEIAAAVWAAGLCLMLLYAFITWLRLRLRVRVSLETGPRVHICDYVDTPLFWGSSARSSICPPICPIRTAPMCWRMKGSIFRERTICGSRSAFCCLPYSGLTR